MGGKLHVPSNLPRGKSLQCQLYMRLGGLRVAMNARANKYFSLQGIEPKYCSQ
jgi:hypothetical protein